MSKSNIDYCVESVMTTNIITIKDCALTLDVLNFFKKYHYNTLPIIDSKNEFVGVINEDIILQCILIGSVPSATLDLSSSIARYMGDNAGSIMDAHPITISKDISIKEAANLMIKHSISPIYVVEDKKLVGVVSKRDIINKVYTKESQEE